MRVNVVDILVALLKLNVHKWHAVPCRVVSLQHADSLRRSAELRCVPLHHLSLGHVLSKADRDVGVDLDTHVEEYLICVLQVLNLHIAPVQGRDELSVLRVLQKQISIQL